MVPDINLSDYYFKFIQEAKVDAYRAEKAKDEAIKIRDDYYNQIIEHKDDLIRLNNLDVTKYTKELNKEYNDTEALYMQSTIIYKKSLNKNINIYYLLAVIKYCNALRVIYTADANIRLTNKRTQLNIVQYRALLSKYFIKVHKCLLEGNGYEFGYGTGVLTINRYKYLNKKKAPKLDYAGTKKRKQELINAGVKIFDASEKALYDAKGIPYDGVDYRVYLTAEHFYKVQFFYGRATRNRKLEYQKIARTDIEIRCGDYKAIADKYVTKIEDIYSLPIDLHKKLAILLYKYPEKYLNFVRNVADDNRTVRAYNREN